MKYLRYLGNRQVSVDEIPIPVPSADEVLVRICCSALCGSERSDFLKDSPTEPNTGHEYTGIIEDPNGSSLWKKGDRVTIHVTYGCGECEYCREGMQQFCRKMRMLFGGHAEFIAVPERACVRIPDDMTQQEAVLLSADTIGVAYRAVKQLHTLPGSHVLVTGAGPVGLGAIVLLKHLGYQVIISEPEQIRREYALSVGADFGIDPITQNLSEEIDTITNHHGIESIIECSGNARVQVQVLDVVRCRGTVVFAGENSGTIPVSPSGHFTRKEMHLTGVWYQSDEDFTEITQLFRNGLDALPLVSHSIAPEQIVDTVPLFFDGKTAKVIINWHSENGGSLTQI